MSQYHQQSDECDVLKAPWLHGAHEVIMSTQISLRPKASRGQLFELLVGSETRRRVDKPSVASESQRTEQDFEAVEHIMIHYDEKTWAPLSFTGPNELEKLHTKTFTQMFKAALFIIAKIWKQPRCISIGEWISVVWYTQTMK